jgi:hypothetical protein
MSETFGNVILEAFASGLPVVAFDSPGVNERVVHNHNGLLVSPQEDFSEALWALCYDNLLRRRLSYTARHSAELQDWEPIFDGLVCRYRQHVLGRTAGLGLRCSPALKRTASILIPKSLITPLQKKA